MVKFIIQKNIAGMASRESRISIKQSPIAPEGVSVYISYNGSVRSILEDLIGNIKSRIFLFSELKI